MLLAYRRSRDSFHPLVITAPMFAILYAVLPFAYADNLPKYLSQEQIFFVQLVNFLGVTSYCAGCLYGSRNANKLLRNTESVRINSETRKRLIGAAIALGTTGLTAYLISIYTVGGFTAAYGQSYGGGWSDYGYIRDAVGLCVLAIMLLLIAFTNYPLKGTNQLLVIVVCAIFASPFLAQGFLGGRRGPTFFVASALGLGWYMMRRQRPRLSVMVASGLLFGMLLLFIVANRSSFYLGSDFQFERSALSQLQVEDQDRVVGNEFIYASGVISHRVIKDEYYWGRRYLAMIFVRPIPRQIWENKYEDMGVGEMVTNAGLGTEEFQYTLGWSGQLGAAPGIIADVWVEFWWFCLPVLFAFGWAYGYVWKSTITGGVLPTVTYIIMISLSLFLVWQTFEALIGKFLFILIPAFIVWKWANVKSRRVYSRRYANLNERHTSVPHI